MPSEAPLVVSNLWDVTDKDIDRFCVNLLERMLCDDGENQCRNSGVNVLDAVSSPERCVR